MDVVMFSLAGCMLLCTGANLVDLAIHRGRMFYFPAPGILRWVTIVWEGVLLVSAILVLVGTIPGEIFTAVLFSFGIVQEVYSILVRRKAVKDCRNRGEVAQ